MSYICHLYTIISSHIEPCTVYYHISLLNYLPLPPKSNRSTDRARYLMMWAAMRSSTGYYAAFAVLSFVVVGLLHYSRWGHLRTMQGDALIGRGVLSISKRHAKGHRYAKFKIHILHNYATIIFFRDILYFLVFKLQISNSFENNEIHVPSLYYLYTNIYIYIYVFI